MKKKKNEKRQVRVDVLDGVWAALWCRESPNLCPGSLSVTNPADAHGWCFRSQAHITQRTGAAGPCLALLWQFSTLITSTSKNQAKGRIQGTILPCFASSQHRHLKGWAGGNQTTAHHLSCVPGEWLLSFQHKLGTQKLWMSSWAECLPCVPAACFQRAPRKYQFSVLLGRCRCSTESWGQGRFQPSRRIPELTQKFFFQLLCQEAQPGQGLTDISHPEHLYLYLSHVLCHLRHVSSLLQQNCQN